MPNFKVIDMSHFNPPADFTKAKAGGVVGVIHKATQGTGFVDPMYGQRVGPAKAAGLLWGAYHFGTGDDVNAQVAKYLSVVNPGPDTLVALDFEQNTVPGETSMTLAQAKAFLQAVEAKIGRKAVLYGGAYMKEHLSGSSDPYFAAHRLWWAQYSNAPTLPPVWASYWLWQYSDGHHGLGPNDVPGIGRPDVDSYEGTDAQLAAEWAS
jgi:lysozyme